MTLREALNRNVSDDYYISPKGWMVKTGNEGDGTFIDPKSKTVKWTGHNGSELDSAILDSLVEKMEYKRVEYKKS